MITDSCRRNLACAFPIIAKKFPRLRIPPSFLFGARHFGTGVLISTAFVHLLPTAFISLTDSCLPKFWNTTYPAMAGAIAMMAVFFVTGIEMLFTRGLCKGGFIKPDCEATLESGYNARDDSDGDEPNEKEGDAGAGASARGGTGRPGSEGIGGAGGVGKLGFGMAGRRRSRSHSFSQGLKMYEDIGKEQRTRATLGNNYINRSNSSDTIAQVNECPAEDCRQEGECVIECQKEAAESHHAVAATAAIKKHIPGITENLTPQQIHKKALLQVGLLEMGILFHSVFIGMALSVTGGSGFIVLLIAIVFHQTFEGLALGSRIAVLNWKPNAPQPWMMACAYGLT